MDYHLLLNLATDLGHRLAMCGAETFRVEESINRILASYGISSEVFAIPNCLTVSIETEDGQVITRMRRIGDHGNDLDAVERYSGLSRRICAEHPEPKVAIGWLKEVDTNRRKYNLPQYLMGHLLGSFGFALLFGGSIVDGFCAGFCGIVVGLINRFLDKLKTNQFFRLIAASFVMAVFAYIMSLYNIADNADMVIIGTLMLLVPGLLFTNAMRDIIFGDTNSGMNRIVQVFLIAVAIALGTGAAWSTVTWLLGTPPSVETISYSIWVQCLSSMIGCIGYAVIFNIHGPGGLLCALGGTLSWFIYAISLKFGVGDIGAYFFAALFSSVYAESMARIRKYPAISYLVISIFPLIPGAGVYYTMNCAFRDDMTGFSNQGMHTIAIAGVIAVGILLGSSIFKIISHYQKQKKIK